ncbi:hypothetical protein C2845_PMPSC056079 [Panicum miliaceum]|uniref:Uncharacterized protein n=1 Tax=Panicum miliaceum TaxID=4540 RepID=A0A3L6PCF5_PANMI|nr:hypothetical protein C2845_PMPSC056079 [Panicum miliaceum]
MGVHMTGSSNTAIQHHGLSGGSTNSRYMLIKTRDRSNVSARPGSTQVFMQINLDRIPAKYILRRYTRDAKKNLPFDRMDWKLQGKDGETY